MFFDSLKNLSLSKLFEHFRYFESNIIPDQQTYWHLPASSAASHISNLKVVYETSYSKIIMLIFLESVR